MRPSIRSSRTDRVVLWLFGEPLSVSEEKAQRGVPLPIWLKLSLGMAGLFWVATVVLWLLEAVGWISGPRSLFGEGVYLMLIVLGSVINITVRRLINGHARKIARRTLA